jgi:hypothetical protein
MSEANPYGGSPIVGYLIFVVAAITLVIAFVNTPFGEWGTYGYLLGAVLLLFGVTFLYSAVKDRMNIVGRNTSGKTNLIISVIGLIASIVVVASPFFMGNEWTVTTILTTGVFVALGLMFLFGIPASRAKMQAGQ